MTTTNPDGTTTVDKYIDGLLDEEDGYKGTNLIAKSKYGYDDLSRRQHGHQLSGIQRRQPHRRQSHDL